MWISTSRTDRRRPSRPTVMPRCPRPADCVRPRCVVYDGRPLCRAAERFQAGHTTSARRAGRYRQLGEAAMRDRSSRPHHRPPAPRPPSRHRWCGCAANTASARSGRPSTPASAATHQPAASRTCPHGTPGACFGSPVCRATVCRATPVTHCPRGATPSRVVGLAPIRPASGRPFSLRSHAPDAAEPALRADDVAVATRSGPLAPRFPATGSSSSSSIVQHSTSSSTLTGRRPMAHIMPKRPGPGP